MTTTSNSVPRVAQIGCGYWGKNLVRTLGQLGALAAVVDENQELAAKLAAKHGCVAATLEDALADPLITAVSIATPAATHHSVALQCLEAGKDVFVEKPMALKPAHARELIEAAKQHDRMLMVGHLLQYHPVFQSLVDLVEAGRLGRLQYVYSNRLNFGKIRREEDILWSFAPHDISMILRLAGEAPSSVRCEGTFALHERIADVTTTHLEFPSGLRGHIFVSWLHPLKEQKLVVIGTKAMAVFDDRADWPEKLALFEGSVEWEVGVPVARPADVEYVEVEQSEPLASEMSHFLESVSSRKAATTDGEEGLRVLQVLADATSQLLGNTETPASDPAPAGPPGVHPTSTVEAGSTVGENTKIWHFSRVLAGSSIGDNCSMGQNVVVGPNVSIGSGTRIQNNVSVYDGVTLEQDVFCGPSMVFTNVITPRAFMNQKDQFAPTLIKRGASIGANATIVCGTTVGEYALIGAGAVVTADVPPHALMLGVPARQAGWVSVSGDVLDDDLVCPRTEVQYVVNDGILSVKEGS